MVWGGDDLVVATFPKSGTHMLVLTSMLVLLKGEWVEETDLHSLIYSPEFSLDTVARDLDEPHEHFPTHPRLIATHMPPSHLHFDASSSAGARFMTVIRDPVATTKSLRRMEQLLFGGLAVPLDKFLEWNLETRETGWCLCCVLL